VWLAVAACALYLAGAVVYAVERPNPLPGTFGYHDVFHLFVIAAAATSFLDVALFVLPVARTVT
jgi:hemolysin III